MGPAGPWAHEHAEWLLAMLGKCWNQERDPLRARPFPSEPEDPQGEEGVAARASRHENAEALILLHSSHIFIQSSVTREGVSRGTRGGDTPPAPPRRGTTQVGVPLH